MTTPTQYIQGAQRSQIALYRFANSSSEYPPIVMTHGTFSNAKICLQMAEYLHENGHDVWVYEWIGHGKSHYGDMRPDAEGFAHHDVPLVLDTVLNQTGAPACHWVAHSGGGFLPLMFMAKNPDRQHQLNTIVGIGSQTTGAGATLKGKLLTVSVSMLMHTIKRVPGPRFGLGPEDETSDFLKQWGTWNRTGKWLGRGGFDYHNGMGQVRIPTLLFAGGDDPIAPASGCRRLFESLGGEQKQFVLCAKSNGYKEDYNHPRLIASKSARAEIWPQVLQFVTKHCGS